MPRVQQQLTESTMTAKTCHAGYTNLKKRDIPEETATDKTGWEPSA